MNEKIGVAIITHNRVDFFKKIQETIPSYVNLYVVNTGAPYPKQTYDSQKVNKIHQCTKPTCVGWGKNFGLRLMIQDGCKHLFTMEDDVYVKDPDVFKKYIKAAYTSGIYHFNFGFSQKENLTQEGKPAIKNLIEYSPDVSLIFTPNVLGAFTYYLSTVIKNIGYHDERFDGNHMDHVDLTYRAIKANLHPPFWWFADINNSWEMIGNLSNMGDDSIVRNEERFMKAITKAFQVFQSKHGCTPVQVPQVDEEQVLQILEQIQSRYSKPDKAREWNV